MADRPKIDLEKKDGAEIVTRWDAALVKVPVGHLLEERDKFAQVNKRTAVLEERIANIKKAQTIQLIGLYSAIAGFLLEIGANMIFANYPVLGGLLVVFAALLIFGPMFLTRRFLK